MVTLIIHGPFDDKFTRRNLAQWDSRRNLLADIDQIVISAYDFQKNEVQALVSDFAELPITAVFCQDVANPSFGNCNRQAHLFSSGLKRAKNSLAIKLRADQSVNLFKALGMLRRRSRVLMTTNCYTRVDRFYHPSDMFMMGEVKELKEYFDDFYSELSAQEHVLAVIRKVKDQVAQPGLRHWPESHYFVRYLEKRNWPILKTAEDSFAALQKYIQVVDSWDLDFTWRKFADGKRVVLPYHSSLRQHFPFGPLEKLQCFSARDFGFEHSVLKTGFYKTLAWIYYEMKHRMK